MRPGVRPGRRLGRGAATLGALVAGFVGGAVLTMALSSPATPTLPGEAAGIPPPGDGVAVPVAPAEPETFLAWVPGGMPGSFSEALDDVAGIRRAVTVRSGVGWMTASWSADGELVDRPPAGLAIPLEVAAVPPGRYAPFLPPAERSVVGALADGEGVLGTMSAELRGLGPGAVLAFGDLRIRIAAVLPDELVGAHELMVSTRTGLALGIRLERYALLQPTPRARLDLEA
ncbi:MAG: hypothetical protein HY658_04325, partial [Actinobacteria bacterium]|nr:hypothetical protein [Actinomycetota bacterium]